MMSIKIYNGLAIGRALSLKEVREVSMVARKRLDAMVEQAQLLAACRVALRAHDQSLIGAYAPDTPITDYSCAGGAGINFLIQERDEHVKGGSPAIPMDFEAVLIPLARGKTLAMGYGHKTLCAAFAEVFQAKPYGYWDNTDPEEGLPRGEWARRERDWKEALGGGMGLSPAEAGMTVKLVSAKYAGWWQPELAEMARAMELSAEFSVQRRAKEMALDMLSAEFFKAQADADHSFAMRSMRAFNEAAQEPELAARIAALTEDFERVLSPLDENALKAPLKLVTKHGAAMREAFAQKSAVENAAGPAQHTASRRKSKPGL